MTSLQRLGGIAGGMATLGIVRLIPEFLFVRYDSRAYLTVVACDLVLVLPLFVAGWALLREKSWAPHMTLLAGGILVSNSVAWGIVIAPEVVKSLLRTGSSEDINLIPRLLYYGIALCFYPYAARVIFRSAPPGTPLVHWVILGSSLAIGGMLMGVVYVSFR